jgi:hypothetical protein
MRKTVYLIEQPLDERNYERFGIQAWIERYWTVEVWDLTPWAHPAVWEHFIEGGQKPQRFAGYLPVASKREFARILSKSEKIDYFIDLTGENYHALRAKLLLKRSGAVRVVCASGSIPLPERNRYKGLLSKIGELAARGPTGSLRWLTNAFCLKVIAPHVTSGLAVVAGQKSIDSAKQCRQVIRAHNFDYDIYLQLVKETQETGGDYLVFIDQDRCFHVEYIYQHSSSTVTPEKYFPVICKGLKRISEALRMEVRVAGHPRATYQKSGVDYFKGFPVEYGRTAELIRDCRVVVGHDSTALQFAVLFGKPIIFVTTDELTRSSYEGGLITNMAAELGKIPINLDGDLSTVDWPAQLHVDTVRYALYRSRFIKTDGSPELPLWQIVINHIERARPHLQEQT